MLHSTLPMVEACQGAYYQFQNGHGETEFPTFKIQTFSKQRYESAVIQVDDDIAEGQADTTVVHPNNFGTDIEREVQILGDQRRHSTVAQLNNQANEGQAGTAEGQFRGDGGIENLDSYDSEHEQQWQELSRNVESRAYVKKEKQRKESECCVIQQQLFLYLLINIYRSLSLLCTY